MANQDPVLEVLLKIKDSLPVSIQSLVDEYTKNGIDGLGDAWKEIIKAAVDENQ
jgi:hypothetical protein